MKLIYMAHPVAGDVPLNLKRAKAWLKWLIESRDEPCLIIAPWITECELWDDSDPKAREIGMARCLAMIDRCDELWLVGGVMSSGMEAEMAHAIERGKTVVNLLAMGQLAPPPQRISNVTISYDCEVRLAASLTPPFGCDLFRSQSPWTLLALRVLMEAMTKDNAKVPWPPQNDMAWPHPATVKICGCGCGPLLSMHPDLGCSCECHSGGKNGKA